MLREHGRRSGADDFRKTTFCSTSHANGEKTGQMPRGQEFRFVEARA